MKQAVGAEDVTTFPQEIRVPLVIADPAASLIQKKQTGGHVPGFQACFPESVGQPGGHIGYVEGGLPGPANRSGGHYQASEGVENSPAPLENIVRETGVQKGPAQLFR